MPQKGTHTWDLYLAYHQCPNCSYIIENRVDYAYRLGKYIKDVECPRCHALFTLTRQSKTTFGPLIGDPQPLEFDWSS